MADMRPAWLKLNEHGYLDDLRARAKNCAAFWWHSPTAGIMHNGTVCFVDTGQRIIGITADHVYQGYLDDRAQNDKFVCQFGNQVVRPEDRLIDRNKRFDLATFALPERKGDARTYLAAPNTEWPPARLAEGEWVLYGGYPGTLREAKETKAEFDFESIFTQVRQVTPQNIILEVNYAEMFWPDPPEGRQVNTVPDGASGGPVYWVNETSPLTHLTLVGFISQYQEVYGTMLAKHADLIRADGSIAT